MKPRGFLDNIFGISLLYDAVLFIIMVSLAGVVLLPALRSNIAVETSVEKHREHFVDETLQAYLASRADSFEYRFCGDIIDTVAGHIGIDNASNGLYQSITHWILAHEQLHKTYATLIAEDLGCQFQLPFTVLGMNRLNILTADYDRQLSNETNRFFSHVFQDKFEYNITAWWHPIKGISFGGAFYSGRHPPLKDSYVAQSCFIMPYSPIFTIGNHTVVFTKYWLKHQLFSNGTGFGETSIPSLANITLIFENYTNDQSPFDKRENATKAVRENLSTLVYGFLINGITNETNITVFPGIVNMTLTYGFEKIKHIIGQFFEDALNETFGDAIRNVDRVFSGLNESVTDPVSKTILEDLNTTVHTFCNGSFPSLDDAIGACEIMIKENVTMLLKGFLDSYIESFVESIFDVIDTIHDFAEMLVNWLFDRVSLNTAIVTLTIWAVRE
jgi:hypothetical protein